MIRRAVLAAAGLGTRMLSATKELPKEMLPVFARGPSGKLAVKPMLQLVFEQLHGLDLREFCFIVGREKRAIEDHFSLDQKYLDGLSRRGKREQSVSLYEFYEKVSSSAITWINQHSPMGFGHAVLLAKHFVGEQPFLVHAGDSCVVAGNGSHLRSLIKEFEETRADAALTLIEVENPRQYGVAEAERKGRNMVVRRVVEKPSRPKSNLAIAPMYVFRPRIFEALESISAGKGGELQLTDGIQRLLEKGCHVSAVLLRRNEQLLDIGTPETYWEAQKASYRYSSVPPA